MVFVGLDIFYIIPIVNWQHIMKQIMVMMIMIKNIIMIILILMTNDDDDIEYGDDDDDEYKYEYNDIPDEAIIQSYSKYTSTYLRIICG